MSDSPLDRMILGAVRCVKCGAGFGKCNCWAKCNTCGWTYETGKKCRRCNGDPTPEIIAEHTPRKHKGRKP